MDRVILFFLKSESIISLLFYNVIAFDKKNIYGLDQIKKGKKFQLF
jgi:hypothetical protein